MFTLMVIAWLSFSDSTNPMEISCNCMASTPSCIDSTSSCLASTSSPVCSFKRDGQLEWTSDPIRTWICMRALIATLKSSYGSPQAVPQALGTYQLNQGAIKQRRASTPVIAYECSLNRVWNNDKLLHHIQLNKVPAATKSNQLFDAYQIYRISTLKPRKIWAITTLDEGCPDIVEPAMTTSPQ